MLYQPIATNSRQTQATPIGPAVEMDDGVIGSNGERGMGGEAENGGRRIGEDEEEAGKERRAGEEEVEKKEGDGKEEALAVQGGMGTPDYGHGLLGHDMRQENPRDLAARLSGTSGKQF